MKILVAVAFVLSAAIPAMANGGEDQYMPVPAGALSFTQTAVHEKHYDQMRMGIRVPFLGGDIDTEGEKWSDFFNTGIGLDFSGAYLFRTSDKFAIGPYVATTFDFFGGKKQEFSDSLGDFSLTPDTMVMTRITFGVKLRENLGPKFFLEQHMGIGVALYSATDFTYRDDANKVSLSAIDASVAFAFELGLRAGFAVSPKVDLGMGMAVETNSAPDAGVDFEDVTPKGQSNFVLSFFINLNF